MSKVIRSSSTFVVKRASEGGGGRILTGLASSPKPDRLGDVVVPEGVHYRLPVPFLLQHNPNAPIGTVTSIRVKSDGLRIEASIPKISEPASLADRIENAWASISAGLIPAMSIGFRSIKAAPIGKSGIRFDEWELLEISAVTIPAHPAARFDPVKSLIAAKSSASTSGPWRKGAVLRVTERSAYRALRDTSLPPWKANLSWELIA